MRIKRGIQAGPQKVVLYGPEGIGKSTFAAQFPNPLFLDVEEGTGTWTWPGWTHPRPAGRRCWRR